MACFQASGLGRSCPPGALEAREDTAQGDPEPRVRGTLGKGIVKRNEPRRGGRMTIYSQRYFSSYSIPCFSSIFRSSSLYSMRRWCLRWFLM